MFSVRQSLDYMVVTSFILHLSLFIVAIIGLKKKKMFSYAIFVYLFSISIYMNIPKIIPGILAERFTFIAVLGFCIILGKLLFDFINRYVKSQNFKYLLIIALIIPYAVQTYSRNMNWKDHLTLFEHDIKFARKSVKMNDLLATGYMDMIPEAKTYDEAKILLDNAQKYYRRCTRLFPENALYWNDLGSIQYVYFLNYDSALYYFRKSRKFDPKNTEILFNISQSYLFLGDTLNAIKSLNEIIETDSINFKAISSLSNLFIIKKDVEQVEYYSDLLKKHYPQDETSFILSGNCSIIKKDTIGAIKNYETAFKLNPENSQTIKILMYLYNTQGMQDKALQCQNYLKNSP